MSNQEAPKKKGKITAQDKKDLLYLGPYEFAKRRGVSLQGVSIYCQVFRKLGGVLTEEMKPQGKAKKRDPRHRALEKIKIEQDGHQPDYLRIVITATKNIPAILGYIRNLMHDHGSTISVELMINTSPKD